MIWAHKYWRVYLYGPHPVEVYTDNSAVRFLLQPAANNQPSQRMIRWVSQLQDFDFIIKHRAGTQNADADAVSRSPSRWLLPGHKRNP